MKEQLRLDTLAAAVLSLRDAQKAWWNAPEGPDKLALLAVMGDHAISVDRMLLAWQEQQAQRQHRLFDECC